MRTTVGQLLINDQLPKDLQDHNRVFTKKNLMKVFKDLAEKHPHDYGKVTTALNRLGYQVAFERGSSFSLDELEPAVNKEEEFEKTEKSVASLRMQYASNPKKRDEEIAKEYMALQKRLTDKTLQNGLSKGNRLAQMVYSGARGKPSQLGFTISSAVMYADHKDRPILVPIKSSFAEGYDPAEYWASSYGTRKGQISTKFATMDAGSLAKMFSQTTFQQVVTKHDCGTDNGVVYPIEDPDNVDSFLAKPVGPYVKNDKCTPTMIANLKKAGVTKIVLRSPITCAASQGICAMCRGVIEKNTLPAIGENVGLTSSAAMAEPIGQMQLNVKHTGGVAGVGGVGSGYETIKQLTSIPKEFPNRAELARLDGRVEKVEVAPQGGTFITINGERHYSLPQTQVRVKVGEIVEEGDALDNGLPNPSEVVMYKGVGEGRKYFAEKMRETMASADINVNRRHVEVMSRALINKAQVDNPDVLDGEGILPDEIIDFQQLQNSYKSGTSKVVDIDKAQGKFLAEPILHYTVGTPIRPSVVQTLKDQGVTSVKVDDVAPPFRPIMIRIEEAPLTGSDWMTRLYSRGLQKSILEATHRGREAPDHSISFVPSLVRGVAFGRAPGGKPKY